MNKSTIASWRQWWDKVSIFIPFEMEDNVTKIVLKQYKGLPILRLCKCS